MERRVHIAAAATFSRDGGMLWAYHKKFRTPVLVPSGHREDGDLTSYFSVKREGIEELPGLYGLLYHSDLTPDMLREFDSEKAKQIAVKVDLILTKLEKKGNKISHEIIERLIEKQYNSDYYVERILKHPIVPVLRETLELKKGHFYDISVFFISCLNKNYTNLEPSPYEYKLNSHFWITEEEFYKPIPTLRSPAGDYPINENFVLFARELFKKRKELIKQYDGEENIPGYWIKNDNSLIDIVRKKMIESPG